jgi:hypothetical protein
MCLRGGPFRGFEYCCNHGHATRDASGADRELTWRRRSPSHITVAGAVRVDKRTDWSRYRWWDRTQEAKAGVGRHYHNRFVLIVLAGSGTGPCTMGVSVGISVGILTKLCRHFKCRLFKHFTLRQAPSQMTRNHHLYHYFT